MRNWERIARELSTWRARNKLTQLEFANMSGVSLSVVSRLEGGHQPSSMFSERTIARVAQALPRSVGSIITHELGYDPNLFVYTDDSDTARERLGDIVDRLDDNELNNVRRYIEWVIAQRDG